MRRLAMPMLLAALLAGCGSQTKTVTVANAPAPATSSSTTQSTAATTPAPASTTAATAPSSTSSSATRTAPEPSFTEQETHTGEGASAATEVLTQRGYTAKNPSEYHAGQTLRVLVGTRDGSTEGHAQQAFFFLDGRYLGTDTKEPSAQMKVLSQSDTEVAIAYGLYRQGDSLCCPSGGQRVVHFALNNGKLTALDPIPPASSSSGLSRN
jgi:hypothetical protein